MRYVIGAAMAVLLTILFCLILMLYVMHQDSILEPGIKLPTLESLHAH